MSTVLYEQKDKVGTLRGTADALEGPKAFAEKRKPNFRAR
jgi:1,4-dihydroxy-2-naphthoyl-CoA synthase